MRLTMKCTDVEEMQDELGVSRYISKLKYDESWDTSAVFAFIAGMTGIKAFEVGKKYRVSIEEKR